MTQRRWDTLDGYRVLTGWNVHLRRYFLVIERACVGCDGSGQTGGARCRTCRGTGDDLLFSNLRSPKYPYGDMVLRDVLDELRARVTEIPPTLAATLTRDCLGQSTGGDTDYGVLGTTIPETERR